MAGLALMPSAECRNAAVSSGVSGVMDARGMSSVNRCDAPERSWRDALHAFPASTYAASMPDMAPATMYQAPGTNK